MNGSIRSRIPYEEYAKIPAISITRLKELCRSGLHYQHNLRHPKTSEPLKLGIGVHTAVLEPERFEAQFAVWRRRGPSGQICPRNGQYWDAFLALHPGKDPDRDILTEDQYNTAKAMAAAVRSNRATNIYLEAGEPEVSMQWEQWVEAPMGLARSVPCRGRIDWITRSGEKHTGAPILVGLKGSRDARPLLFGKQAFQLGYHMQWAFYHDAYMEIKGVKPLMREIVVENTPPYDVVVYRIGDDIIQQGRADYDTLLKRWVEYDHLGAWPGIANGGELELTLPTYAYPQEDDISELGLEE